jgi:K+-transporting ATPase ATPase C chain
MMASMDKENLPMRALIRPAVILLFTFTLLAGLLYPLAVTGLAQLVFPRQANGSLIVQNGQVVGSRLIGQPFDNPKYFWGRLSATSPYPYNAAASSGSNLGPTNPALLDEVKGRIAALKAADPTNTQPIPVDLVTSSGSGLDPDISLAAALYQLPRVARARGLSESSVRSLVDQYTQGRTFGFLGEARVNVLELNLALDKIKK